MKNMGEFIFSVMYGGSLIIIGIVVQILLKKMDVDKPKVTDVRDQASPANANLVDEYKYGRRIQT
jgi:hypothetical protein